jgi:hypothetical protein
MIYQDDPRLNSEINHYGCYFMALAFYREHVLGEAWKPADLQAVWDKAKAEGVITGDLNGDGDEDDPGELEIVKPDRLCELLGLPLKYRDGHFPADQFAPDGGWTITAWHRNGASFNHFVVGNHRPVLFDPIAGGSKTVREGYPISNRIYEKA